MGLQCLSYPMSPPSSKIYRPYLLILARSFLIPFDRCIYITAPVHVFGVLGWRCLGLCDIIGHWAFSFTLRLDILISSLPSPPLVSISVLTENEQDIWFGFDSTPASFYSWPSIHYTVVELVVLCCLLYLINIHDCGGEEGKEKQLYSVCFNLQGLIQLDFWHVSLVLCFLSSQA